MHKQIALAYAIAGLAVAAALLVVVGSTTGWFPDQIATDSGPIEPASPPAPAPTPKPAATPLPPVIPATSQAVEPVETVYVDEPAPQKRRHHDDDDDDDDHSHERESDDD
jgi:hypothetical protein